MIQLLRTSLSEQQSVHEVEKPHDRLIKKRTILLYTETKQKLGRNIF